MPRPTHSGLLTAGSLWTPLHDETTFEENIDNLIVQITKELMTSNPDEQDEEVENDPGQDLFSVEDIKGEIERMREDMAPGDAAAASKSSSGDTLAAIPSLSPQLPRGVRSGRLLSLSGAMLRACGVGAHWQRMRGG